MPQPPPDPARTPASRLAAIHVIHVAGRLGKSVSHFLDTATATLATTGVQQTLVLVDDPDPPPWTRTARPQLTVVSSPGASNRLRTWWQAMRAVQQAAVKQPEATVHLHGLLPSVFGARALRCAAVRSPICYSLHGERALAPWPGVAAIPLWMQARSSKRPQVRIMNSPFSEDLSPRWFENHAHEYLEAPVAPSFLAVQRQELRQPLIMSGSRADRAGRAAALYAQLAVLLGGQDLRVRFQWLTGADGTDTALLRAAGVDTLDLAEPAQATCLSQAWMYLSLDAHPDTPYDIARAMAAGLPCVALDSRSNRNVVSHGLTGFLCRDLPEVMRRVAELLDDEPLRTRMSLAARESARRRFSTERFQAQLLRVYGLDAMPA